MSSVRPPCETYAKSFPPIDLGARRGNRASSTLSSLKAMICQNDSSSSLLLFYVQTSFNTMIERKAEGDGYEARIE